MDNQDCTKTRPKMTSHTSLVEVWTWHVKTSVENGLQEKHCDKRWSTLIKANYSPVSNYRTKSISITY